MDSKGWIPAVWVNVEHVFSHSLSPPAATTATGPDVRIECTQWKTAAQQRVSHTHCGESGPAIYLRGPKQGPPPSATRVSASSAGIIGHREHPPTNWLTGGGHTDATPATAAAAWEASLTAAAASVFAWTYRASVFPPVSQPLHTGTLWQMFCIFKILLFFKVQMWWPGRAHNGSLCHCANTTQHTAYSSLASCHL